ncbi:hypothetical protein [Streptomyces sp. NBC_01262]|uniref:hypothetical protein n=1 Tax=Streptomyces sp. NBC_01262 TaxID=2903803 RepID=UPI002E375C42|nr:hypothetical protein [Streptomyces sp. NBC_01262]
MARIRVLEAVAGDDFSWAPGDIVDLPQETAAGWADGHRAVWADGDNPATGEARPYELPPLVTTADGVELEVVQAVVQTVHDPTADPGSPDPVRWSVTIALPAVAALDPAAVVTDGSGVTVDGGVADAVTGGSGDGDMQQLREGGFDPITHPIREVLAYLGTVSEQEVLHVLALEEAGEDRKGIARERDALLEAAQARDAAAEQTGDGDQLAAEKTADLSRGGGRGNGIETR